MFSLALTKILKSGAEKSNTIKGQAGKMNEQNILGEACGDLKNSCPFHNWATALSYS